MDNDYDLESAYEDRHAIANDDIYAGTALADDDYGYDD